MSAESQPDRDPAAETGPEASLDEIRGLMRGLPGPDEAAAEKARAREAELTKPAGALGRLETLAEWAAAWQGRHPARAERPRVAVFAANHGIAARGVSAYPSTVTAQMVANFQRGGAAVNQLCLTHDAELRVYEMALDHPTNDFTTEPAMGEADVATALAYGMMAVEEGVDILCLGEMGIGNSTSAAALAQALFGGEARDWTGPGTGVEGAAMAAKIAAVEAGVALHGPAIADPFDALRRLGGLELAAITGAVIAARMGRVPVILDGYAATVAAAVLHAVDARALDHCVVAHRSAEPGHARLLEVLDKQPLLDLGMRLGEGSGAAVALGIVKSALACHAGMATFAEASVSGPAG
ncbi:nicotinate-nucleotide--dimethylbenzimidazole phosphoribosyltransferase [Marivibrio halodurans]|uniref:Nicotinate-nucleotide--dimethylbenzimidazole phosphoribosyltransferase n=1 Tax=Marivibrio halodurans TaxID=2039722 RepID=A0A8J7S779_9PROT|nr:nicotinate-nucleotide--dimethylbenzimidazole phosphoribosyltransferase [Marivibrio halodurans]MBP5858099.1 nicotinate-nucleotide--dimethylbenzimidazole phosphoribosyltransferase [Marivibrio halodurans]